MLLMSLYIKILILVEEAPLDPEALGQTAPSVQWISIEYQY